MVTAEGRKVSGIVVGNRGEFGCWHALLTHREDGGVVGGNSGAGVWVLANDGWKLVGQTRAVIEVPQCSTGIMCFLSVAPLMIDTVEPVRGFIYRKPVKECCSPYLRA